MWEHFKNSKGSPKFLTTASTCMKNLIFVRDKELDNNLITDFCFKKSLIQVCVYTDQFST